jgi:hypothetical protein
MNMKTIVVERTESFFKAYLKDSPQTWGLGKTSDEAVGCLIRLHQQEFGVDVKLL